MGKLPSSFTTTRCPGNPIFATLPAILAKTRAPCTGLPSRTRRPGSAFGGPPAAAAPALAVGTAARPVAREPALAEASGTAFATEVELAAGSSALTGASPELHPEPTR